MPRRGGKHYVLVEGAEEALTAFKMEIANELGFKVTRQDDFKRLTTEQVGQIGGTMVRRLQALGEQTVKQRHKDGLSPLLPDELMPKKSYIRDVSNTGKIAPELRTSVSNNEMIH